MGDYFKYWGKAKSTLEVDYCTSIDTDNVIAKRHKLSTKQLWQKAKQNGWKKVSKGSEYTAYHLLPYHCLDVAAVGQVLLENNPFLLDGFVKLCGIEKEVLKPALIFFLTLHDLGKFSESFQNIKPKLLEQLQEIEYSKKDPYSKKQFGHDSIGFLIWNEIVFDLLTKQLNVDACEDWKDLLSWLMEASNGHHGLPPKRGNQMVTNYFNDSDIQAVESFVHECLKLFEIEELFKKIDVDISYDDLYVDLAKSSWALTGFYVLCDWIGSGETFKYCNDTSLEFRDYFGKIAIPMADRAVKEAGILPCKVNCELDPLKQLLDLPEGSKLTPLQELVGTIDLSKQPQLFIIEDETGAGKTEASLILLNRLMAKGVAQGFYLALPTMATADGIYPRVKKTYGKLYEEGQQPSLVLSHSSAKLSKKFTDSILYSQTQENQQQYEDDAQSRCLAWLADNRKKSLLAHVGVGTIDQAFLAVLKVKYQSLRLIGLLGKILVIDEAHAYDAYMGKELEVLLEVHAAMGGTAIIMSATLPLNTRKKLGSAFLKGLGGSPVCQLSEHRAYPLLTHISADQQLEIPCRINPRKQKKAIHYEIVHDETYIHDLIKKSLAQNQSVCWIRNCVRDARDSYQIWAGKHDKVDLFHARFVLADRLSVQE
jgi:CRISPR-associated endonuclease/helicase Cas3